MRVPKMKPGDIIHVPLTEGYVEVMALPNGVQVRTFPNYISVESDCGNVVRVVERMLL